MSFDSDGYPMMYVFKGCKNLIRTLPSLIYDDRKVEDLNTDGEDHCADALRYMCMSRPITPRKPEPEDPFIRDPARVALDLKKEDLAPVRVRPRMIIKRG